MRDVRSSRFIIIVHVIFLWIANSSCSTKKHVEAIISEGYLRSSVVPVGLVLDTNSPFGSMLDLCMNMAVSDFYENHSNYTTTLQLHTKNVAADSVLEANFAAVELLEHEQVEVIIGPQGSTQNIFMSELGLKSHVPIISSTARSLALSTSTTQNSFYVRTTVDDSVQARALASICQGFQWPQVVLLYEDTDYGHQFQSHLSNAFRDVEIRLVHLTPIPLSASDNHLFEQLGSLNEQETRVFLVHMSPPLGFRLFNIAKNVGMMTEGNAWIITDSLSNFLSSTTSATRDSMEGVLGLRAYVAPSKDLVNFQERWERNSSRASMDLNVYGLWAYDTITALAIAAENIGPVTLHKLNKTNVNVARSDPSLRFSSYGPRLLREVSRTRFRGLSGHFQVSDGSLKPSSFEIMNLIGTGERIVGLWNPFKGTTLRGESYHHYSTSTIEFKSIIWPGDSTNKPKGWAIPPAGILRVGVPWKPGFKQFVNVTTDPETNQTRVNGFAIDIFLYSLKQLPFPVNYTFLCYNESKSTNWSYDSMLKEIPLNYDIVVADTTIWAPRASYVDFTLPYSESGIVLVVRNNRPLDMWIFLKPLSLYLWLAILATCVVVGVVIWRIEPVVADPHAHVQNEQPERIQQDVQEPNRGHDDRLRIAFLVPVAALAFQERALVQRKTSLFILVCWLFTAFILMQSYTANLAAILTLDQWKFSFSEDHYFGYHDGSFTREFLTEKLHISPKRLISYQSVEGYHEGMRRGSKNGGIDGIFDELPYMKIFLNRYDSQYRIIGPQYRTDGLGFALQIGSPLVSHFSRAILNVTQGSDMMGLEQKNFGPGYSSQDPLSDTISQGGASLTFNDFSGLFIIIGTFTLIAFTYAEKANVIRWGKQGLQYINNLRHGGDYAAVAVNGVGEREGNDADEVNNEGQEQDRGADHVNEERRD